MKKVGEILSQARLAKNITLEDAASELRLKSEIIEALEKGDWELLPEPAYVRGFIKNYAYFLGEDSSRLLALYRAEYDEKRFPHKQSPYPSKKRLMFTPNKLAPLAFLIAALIFAVYLSFQYFSLAKTPSLEIFSPQNDLTTTASVIEISGKTSNDAKLSIDGELVSPDQNGNFYHQLKLKDGRNLIEVVASRKLSPKARKTLLVRLSQ